MKKYILSVATFLMIAGIASAQAKKTSTDKPVVKTHKTTAKKTTVSSSVSSTTPTTDKSTASTGTIKRKHHKKSKSVPASK